MTSPPAQHDPADDGPGREDADAHPPLGQIEAGPQRHSDDPFAGKATEVVSLWFISEFAAQRPRPNAEGRDRLIEEIADALKSVDRAAREECARIADEASQRTRYEVCKIDAHLIALLIRKTIA